MILVLEDFNKVSWISIFFFEALDLEEHDGNELDLDEFDVYLVKGKFCMVGW